MKQLTFDKKRFFITLLSFLFLTTVWTILCIRYDEFTDYDKGFYSGLGFLLLLSVSLYFGQLRLRPGPFITIAFFTILIFLISSFLLAPLIAFTNNSMVLYSILNSCFVAVTMTLLLNKVIGIQLRWVTVSITIVFLLAGYGLMSLCQSGLQLDYNIHPRMTMFNIIQFFLIIPLALGMTIRKKEQTA